MSQTIVPHRVCQYPLYLVALLLQYKSVVCLTLTSHLKQIVGLLATRVGSTKPQASTLPYKENPTHHNYT